MKFLEEIVRLAERLDQVSYYELLGVESDCPAATILERYYLLAPKLHPDRFVRHCGPEQMSALNRVSARLGEARRVLSTPQSRAEYDAGLAKGTTRASNDQKLGRKGLKDEQDPKTPVARKFLDQARQLMADKDYRKARSTLDLALKYEPNSAALKEAMADLEKETSSFATRKKPLTANMAEATPIPGTLKVAPAPPLAEATPVPGTYRAPLVPSAPATTTTSVAAPLPAKTSTSVAAQLPVAPREHARFPVAVPVKLKADTRDKLGTLMTRDISSGGMFLKTGNKKFEQGDAITLMVTGPEGLQFEIPSEVVRVVGPPEGPGIGVRFQELPRPTMARIEQILSNASSTADVHDPTPAAHENLEWLVSEFLRFQALTPAEILDVPPGTPEAAVSERYRELMRKYNPGRPTGADAQAITDICKQILASIRSAHEILTKRPSAPGRLLTPAPVPEAAPLERDDSELVTKAYLLICDQKYEETIELLKDVPTGGNKHNRLRAARHVARGYIAQIKADRVVAQREFATALALDKTCLEAIRALRRT